MYKLRRWGHVMFRKHMDDFKKLPLAESKVTFINVGIVVLVTLLGGVWWVGGQLWPPKATLEMPAAEAEMDKILKERTN